MKNHSAWQAAAFLAVFTALAVLFAPAKINVQADTPPYMQYLPLIAYGSPPAQPEAIIINHTTIDISQIPDYWLDQAKLLAIHYAHTSHGSQITTGLTWLESQNSKYNIFIRTSDSEALIPVQNPAAIRMYDGNPPETYIEPGDYWDGTSGLNRTRAVASTGHYNFSMWSWCGQQSSNSESTVQSYLAALDLLESEYPSMRFIYMTGHTDGSQDNLDSTLRRNNQMVRDYVLANDKVLFDFADIESWDPDGGYHANTDDSCPWCATWCSTHASYCANFDTNFYNQCHDGGHTHPLICKMKANAFWWMMARLAGWPGPTSK